MLILYILYIYILIDVFQNTPGHLTVQQIEPNNLHK